jgi:hypothetical protein
MPKVHTTKCGPLMLAIDLQQSVQKLEQQKFAHFEEESFDILGQR